MVAVACALAPVAHAQSSAQIPAEIAERLWLDPGPEQSSPDAPRLMLIYPKKDTKLEGDIDLTRYAGRVDPPDAEVQLNGEPITVFRGGVFTGVLKIPVGERTVRFTGVSASGAKTEIVRTIRREPPPPIPAHRPMEFRSWSAVEPEGSRDYWLREGETFRFRVAASPGNKMELRVGPLGDWLPMREVKPWSKEGGAYVGEVEIGPDLSENKAGTIYLRLSALDSIHKADSADETANDAADETGDAEIDPSPIEFASKLALGRAGPNWRRSGVTRGDLITFLKEPEGWDRWGNWMGETTFPIVEKHGDRYRVEFEGGTNGFVEVKAAEVVHGLSGNGGGVRLGAPRVSFLGEPRATELQIDWHAPGEMPFVVRADEREMPDGSEGELHVSLLGASSADPGMFRPGDDAADDAAGDAGDIRWAQIFEPGGAGDHGPPTVKVALAEKSLWGYALRKVGRATLRLSVRTRPELTRRTPDLPLLGLRVMVDAGHGGDDMGAIGPSGLAESDVNLSVAGFLGLALEAMGATVAQARTGDAFVSLDDRVQDAWAWDPDLFVSIHANSVNLATHPMKDQGPIVFYHYPQSIPVAEAISAELTKLLMPDQEPRVKYQAFRVNRNLTLCPSVLVETSFICNPRDELKLRDPGTRREIGASIARGIRKLFAD